MPSSQSTEIKTMNMNELSKQTSRTSHVESQMNDLGNLTDLLAKSVDELESKLRTVISIEPEVKSSGDQAVQSIVPLADCIRSQAFKIQGSVSRIESITRRIEL